MHIYVSNTFQFEKEIARLNKKAARIGVPRIQFVNLGQCERERVIVQTGDGETTELRVPVRVTKYALTLPTQEDRVWKLAATLTPAEGGEGVRSFVDAHIPSINRTRWEQADPCACEHCHTNRNRNLTYVVQNKDTGAFVQLGRSCFKDYIGNDALLKMEFCAVVQQMFGEDEGFYPTGGSGGIQVVDTLACVLWAEAISAVEGRWRNNVKEFGHVVADGTHRTAGRIVKAGCDVRAAYNAHSAGSQAEQILAKVQDAAFVAKVEAMIEEVKDLVLPDEDEFGRTLQYCSYFQKVPAQKASLVAYMGQFLRNYKEKLARAEAITHMRHVGEVGKRMTFMNLTVMRVRSFDSAYGTTFFNTLRDEEGNELIWKSNTGLNEGEKLNLKATVKEHSTYKNAPQTVITRAKQM